MIVGCLEVKMRLRCGTKLKGQFYFKYRGANMYCVNSESEKNILDDVKRKMEI